MCTLAIHFRASPNLPLLIAANRDEYLDRPAADPRPISTDPWVVAGQDLSAGGTWLGVNEQGMVAGMLNRRSPAGPDPARRSRGLLCLEVLQTRSPNQALAFLRGTSGDAYNRFNLLVADVNEAYVVTNPGAVMQVTRLPPGVHLLTNLTLNDSTCPRIARSHRLFQRLRLPASEAEAGSLLRELRMLLSDHSTAPDPRANPVDTLCVHLPGYGTRSSSVIAFFEPNHRGRYWHATGPPCRRDYRPVELPTLAWPEPRAVGQSS